MISPAGNRRISRNDGSGSCGKPIALKHRNTLPILTAAMAGRRIFV